MGSEDNWEHKYAEEYKFVKVIHEMAPPDKYGKSLMTPELSINLMVKFAQLNLRLLGDVRELLREVADNIDDLNKILERKYGHKKARKSKSNNG